MSKISELSDGGALQSTDYLIAVRSGGNVKVQANGAVSGTTGSFSGNVTFADNAKAIFGAGSDLQIYHDGSNSVIADKGTGHLQLTAPTFRLRNDAQTQEMLSANEGGAVTAYYAGSQKLATTATGIDVTGTAVTDGLTVAGNVSIDGGTIKLDGNFPAGVDNVALGNNTLSDAAFAGSGNIAIGDSVGSGITTGTNNIGIGRDAMTGVITGGDNIAIGRGAGAAVTSSSYNVAVGTLALNANTTASNNTAVGYQAGNSNTTGVYLTALGTQAGYNNTTANYNVMIGRKTGFATTTGANNAFVGTEAGVANTTGGNNTALGTFALGSNTTASNNTAVGYQAGYTSQESSYNTFVGYQAGYTSNAGSTGLNTCVGYVSGYSLTTGTGNLIIGTNPATGAGYYMTTGSKNTLLGGFNGNQDGLDIRTSSNNIVLSDGDGNPRLYITSGGKILAGQTALMPTFHATSTVQLSSATQALSCTSTGDGLQSPVVVWRQNAAGFLQYFTYGTNNTNVGDISTNGVSTSYNTTSDYRLKENVVEMTGATERLKQLKPSRFNFIADPDKTVDGFLAHEVQSIVPEAITGEKDAVDEEGNPIYQGVDQSKLVPLLVATIQELEARIAALEAN